VVFETLSRNYLETWGDEWAERAPLDLRYLHRFWEFEPEFAATKGMIVLAARLPHAINAYIDVPLGAVVAKVNGSEVRSLQHMQSLLSASVGEFVTIEFWENGNVAVLDRQQALAADEEVAKTYRVTRSPWLTTLDQRSDDGGEEDQ